MLSDHDIFLRYQTKIEAFQKPADITLLGHSLFDYWDQLPTGLPTLLGKTLANVGLGGASTRQYLDVIIKPKRLPHIADDVFIFLGVNDMVEGKEPNYSPKQVLVWLKEIVDEARKINPNAHFYFLEAAPVNNSNKVDNHSIRLLNDYLKTHCPADWQFIETQKYFTDEKGDLKLSYTTDGVHFTAEGYDILTNILETALQNRQRYHKRLSHEQVLKQLDGGFVASCQPVDDGPMDHPDIVAAMAHASEIGSAAGIRIEGVDNLKAARPFVTIPIIGIVKRDLPNTPVRITPFLQDIEDLALAGADIIAVDGTNRPRPETIESAVSKIHELGCLAMADCSNLEEGLNCQKLGFDIVGSTMSGYTGGEIPKEPDYQLVKDLKASGCYVMAEGRYNSPELAKTAIEIGANCVTVGTVLTRLEVMVKTFADSVKSAQR